MAFDEALADRVRSAIEEHRPDVTVRRMFGGIAFMVRGNMCCGVLGSDVMVRVGAAAYEDAAARPHARPMDGTGRPMRGFVLVASQGVASDADLRAWVELGVHHALSLPPKGPSSPADGRRT